MGIWEDWPKSQKHVKQQLSFPRSFSAKGRVMQILTVGLLSDDFLDVESPSLSVDRLDLALSALESAAHDLDGVTLADGDGADLVLGSEFLTQVTTHDLSSDGRGGREVSLSRLSTLARHALVGLHLSFSLDDS